jgi:hypothetical protein
VHIWKEILHGSLERRFRNLAKAHRFTGTRCLGDRWFERQAADQPARLETECDVSGAVRRYRLPIGRQPLGGSQLLEDLKDDRNLRIAYPGVHSGEV